MAIVAVFSCKRNLVIFASTRALGAQVVKTIEQKTPGSKIPIKFLLRHADCYRLSTGGLSLGSGMWTAVSGANAQAQQVESIANNLANADTLGYKKDQVAFKEYLETAERDPAAREPIRGPLKDKDLYPLDGKERAHVVATGNYVNFKQGSLRITNSPLDLAIDGGGFFEVATPQGVRFTRLGAFKVGADGMLVTSEGHPVLAQQPGGLANQSNAGSETSPQFGQGGPNDTQGGVAAGRTISLKDRPGRISITEKGEVYAGEDLVATLGVAHFADLSKLKKVGGQFFESWDPANRISTQLAADSGKSSRVMQGMLETSNVNPVEEMSKLIQANRAYEGDLKALKAYSDIMSREANDIGKL